MKNGIKLLIVDDEPVEREALTVFAREDGRFTEFEEGANGIEAVSIASRFRPDIIVMDIRMPGMDGLTAAAAIRRFDQRTRIVFLTAYGELDYARSAFKVGADDFLLKPLSAEVFSQAMDRAVTALRATGGTDGFGPYDLRDLAPRLVQAIKQASEKDIESLTRSAFSSRRPSDAELPEVRNAAQWLVYQVDSSIKADLGKAYDADAAAEALSRARSTDETIDILITSLIDLAQALTERSDPRRRLINSAIRYIDAHWKDNPSLDEVSEAVGLSRYHFSRIFRTALGRTFSDYLCEKRISKAKELLADSSLPMKQVCELSGFSDPAYFAGVFKRRTGVSPSEYRSLLPEKPEAKLLIKSQ